MEGVRRTRREARGVPSYEDRIRGTLQYAISNPVNKNPTRFIPSVHGFSSLSKTEIKKDAIDIENKSSLVDQIESDSEDEDIERTVERTLAPSCASDSTVLKKRARLAKWVSNPQLVQVDLHKGRAAVDAVQQELSRLMASECVWLSSLELGRPFVSSSLQSCKDLKSQHKSDANLLTSLILSEATRRTLAESLFELLERISNLERVLQDYEAFALSPVAEVDGIELPRLSTTISVDELVYPEDSFALLDSKFPTHAIEKSEIERLFFSIDEVLNQSESAAGNMEDFFLNTKSRANAAETDASKEKEKGEDYHLVEVSKSQKLVPVKERVVALAAKFQASQSDHKWAEALDGMLLSSGAGQKKQKGPTTVTLSAAVIPRTPRDVPLIISPLSQFEDKFLGALLAGPGNSEINRNFHPRRPRAGDHLSLSIVCAEDAALERCKLQSAAATAQNKIRRLRANSHEWKRMFQDGQSSHLRSERLYQQAAQDDYQESKRIRKELLDFGIASFGSGELPMSPIAETASWGGGVAGGGLRIGGAGKGGSKARGATKK